MPLPRFSQLLKGLCRFIIPPEALRGCPGQAFIKEREIDAFVLGFFQSRRQFLAWFHGEILSLRSRKQKERQGRLTKKIVPMIVSRREPRRDAEYLRNYSERLEAAPIAKRF